MREAKNKFKGAHAFTVGDYVMVAGTGNSANVQRRAKPMMKWQGPYQIVRQASVSEFDVRLLGSPEGSEAPVHWTRLKRFAGPDLNVTARLIANAQHDQQKFYVDEFRDWKEVGEGNIELLVKWRGLEETWEPIERLYEDVPGKVMAYLRENAEENPALQAVRKKLKEMTPAITNTTGRGRGGRGRGRGRGRSARGRGGRGRARGGRGRARGRGRRGRARGREHST